MFRNFPKELWVAVRITLVIAVAGGLIYPLVILGVSQVAFNSQANGSLITSSNGTVVGSSLIGQCFYEAKEVAGSLTYTTTELDGHTFYTVDPRYFQGRPSYAVVDEPNGTEELLPLDPPCNPLSSEGSNLAPSNSLLIHQVDTYAQYLHCVGIDTSGSFTAAQLQAAATDPTHDCLSTGATTTPIPIDLATGDFTSFDPDISVAAALAQVDMVAAARGLDPAKVHAVVEANITGRVLWIFGESDVDVLQLNLAMNKAFGAPPALG
ncbi:MAG: potassium-transporting ATPase subunit C [Candidatus Dormiibacterota bacterium]